MFGRRRIPMAEWIRLFQTLVWPIFVIGLVLYFRSTCLSILQAIAERIRSGAPVEAGPGGFKLGAFTKELEKLPDAPQKAAAAAKPAEPTDWRQKRAEEYKRVDGYMLVHVYRPSILPTQKYDIFLFVVRQQKGTEGPPRRQFDEIAKAEFYFGESWGNEIFTVQNTGSVIGVRTHAWGTFLACCRLTFKDAKREPIILFRYVDFHMLQDNPEAK
jgi:hypothetical protein